MLGSNLGLLLYGEVSVMDENAIDRREIKTDRRVCIWTFRKNSSSKMNNHSAMTVGKFILALSDQFKFRSILKLFSLKFSINMI